tara:strand:+ start:28478 stop:29467 length:990 start_codon:yes stop_codon:yes gene_type:complete
MYYFLLILLNILILFSFKNIQKINLYDYPDKIRKFHSEPIFIGGGIVLFINYFFLIIYSSISEPKNYFINFSHTSDYFTWIISPFLIFIIGIYDDKKNLSANKKFLFLTLVYTFTIFFDKSLLINKLVFSTTEVQIKLGYFDFIFSIFAFLVFANAFNMLDGIDLNVAIYSIIIVVHFILRSGLNNEIFTILFFLLVFSYLNFSKKSFLGDGGTYLLSYLISVFFIKSYNANNLFLCDEIFILMLLPGIELLRLFIFRLSNFKNPFSSDRNHLHHLMINKYKNLDHKIISAIINVFFLIIVIIFFTFKRNEIIFFVFVFYYSIVLFLKN